MILPFLSNWKIEPGCEEGKLAPLIGLQLKNEVRLAKLLMYLSYMNKDKNLEDRQKNKQSKHRISTIIHEPCQCAINKNISKLFIFAIKIVTGNIHIQISVIII